ncbi:MAG: AsmA-like C-terminal domain-containing protein [Desulfatiglandaceae bacterium]
MSKTRKISLWTAGALGTLIFLLALAMFALPLLLDQQQAKEMIHSRLSHQVGGKVEFDTVNVSFFPPRGNISGMHLQLSAINGKAGTVSADLKILPLLTGKLKLDELVIKDSKFTIPLPQSVKRSGKTEGSRKVWAPERMREMISNWLSRFADIMPDVSITLQNASLLLTQQGKPVYRFQNLDAEIGSSADKLQIELTCKSNIWKSMRFKGKINADGLNASGKLNVSGFKPEPFAGYFASGRLKNLESARMTLSVRFESENFEKIQGDLKGLVMQTEFFPDAVAVEKAGFTIEPKAITLKDMQITSLKSSMTLSGLIKNYMGSKPSFDLKFKGTVGAKTADWLRDGGYVPSWLNLPTPVSVSNGRLLSGRQQQTALEARLTTANAAQIGLNLIQKPDKWTIKNLTVSDSTSMASMSVAWSNEIIDLDFEGKLTNETLRKLVKGGRYLRGTIRGDFNLHILTQRPAESRIQGTIQVAGLSYEKGLNAPLRAKELSIQAEGETIRIVSAHLDWMETDINLNGNIRFSNSGIVLDLVASCEEFDWEKIKGIVDKKAEKEISGPEKNRGEQENAFGDMNLEGNLVLKADSFKYSDLTWEPFHLTFNLQDKRLTIQLTQGNLCGIRTEGSAQVSPEPMRVQAEVEAQDKPLRPALDCVLESKLMSGEFDLAGKVRTRGNPKNFTDNLQGRFNFTAEDGRIFKFGLLAKVLAVVNITEILKGRAPDLKGEGFGYDSAKASGEIKNGVITLNETYVDGKSLDLAFTGSLDLPEEQIDVTALVTPLKTVDSILENIPIVGDILGENFIAIPVSIKGSLSDAAVTPMPPSAVGKGLLGILERTMKLPVKVIQPFLPEQEKKNAKTPESK